MRQHKEASQNGRKGRGQGDEQHEKFEEWRGVVESLSQDGYGVGSQRIMKDGKEFRRPVFIPFTAPGDEVIARIVEKRGKYVFAELHAIVNPSRARTPSRCKHYGVCGGCNLQHVTYEEQLAQKAFLVEFLLKRRGVLLPKPVTVQPATEREQYRWRAKIAIAFERRVNAGFRRSRSQEIIAVEECFIVAPRIMEAIAAINQTESPNLQASLEVHAALSETGKVSLLIPFMDVPLRLRATLREFFENVYGAHRDLFGNLLFLDEKGYHTSGQVQEHLTYRAAGMRFAYLPGMFIQSNVAMDERLIGTVLEFLTKPLKGRPAAAQQALLDLYAGIGNFTLPAARKFGFVIAVEGDQECVRLGRINATQNEVKNAKFYREPVERHLEDRIAEMKKSERKNEGKDAATEKVEKEGPDERLLPVDTVLLDPPRTGCTEDVVNGLLTLNAQRIVYVSCNPVTLADDLEILSANYRVADLAAVDMFPLTSHIETVVLLERKQ